MHSRDGVLNGLALWAEYKFGQDVLSTGLLYDDQSHVPKWDKFSKQGVILYHNAKAVKKDIKLNMFVTFNPENGDFCFKVE
uniref:Uncharacterized protein n=1 Tax=Biomphalaria glabrata TaxID=6526 RepID=A0A2C9L660_BIOGL